MIADGSCGLHLPRAGAKAEVGSGESANRANIGGVAGENRVKTGLGKGHNFERPTALVETDHGVIHNIMLEAGAAPALNAALAIEEDQFAKGYALVEVLLV